MFDCMHNLVGVTIKAKKKQHVKRKMKKSKKNNAEGPGAQQRPDLMQAQGAAAEGVSEIRRGGCNAADALKPVIRSNNKKNTIKNLLSVRRSRMICEHAALELVASLYNLSQQGGTLQSETIGDYSYTSSVSSSAAVDSMTPETKGVLDKYKRILV